MAVGRVLEERVACPFSRLREKVPKAEEGAFGITTPRTGHERKSS
jgi:hypothetical protein